MIDDEINAAVTHVDRLVGAMGIIVAIIGVSLGATTDLPATSAVVMSLSAIGLFSMILGARKLIFPSELLKKVKLD